VPAVWWFLSVALVVALLAVAIVVFRRSRRAGLGGTPVPRLPVVLVPGFGAFDKLGAGPIAQHYFRGVARALRDAGVEVHTAQVPSLGSVPARAERLAAFVRSLPHARVNILAHSMGGLDARWAIAKLGLSEKVAALVTIGTPHHGTPLADAASKGPTRWARSVLARIGVPSEAVEWLSTDGAKRVHLEAPNHPDVTYASVVCKAGALWKQNPFLLATHAFISRYAGANDGIVPTSSQLHGDCWLELDLDHWSQIGWSLNGAHVSLYQTLLARLADLEAQALAMRGEKVSSPPRAKVA
jgi:triacylglycerol lipase